MRDVGTNGLDLRIDAKIVENAERVWGENDGAGEATFLGCLLVDSAVNALGMERQCET